MTGQPPMGGQYGAPGAPPPGGMRPPGGPGPGWWLGGVNYSIFDSNRGKGGN